MARIAVEALTFQAVTRPPRQGRRVLTVLALLKQPGGTTLAEICEAIGWTTDRVRVSSSG